MEQQNMENYKNTDLADLPNEEWIDIIGFDGLYEVSNMGRIKSLPREVPQWHGGTRMIKERIMKQSRSIHKGVRGECIVSLQHESVKKTVSVGRIAFESFNPDVRFDELDCVMHKNKIITDNRLSNLKKVKRKISKQTDMKRSNPTIIAVPKNLNKAQKIKQEFYDNRTHKKCSVCGKIDIVENFPNGVSRCQDCINKYVIDKRNNFDNKSKRKCSKCKEHKEQKMFWKNRSWCNRCMAEYLKSWRNKSKVLA